VFLLLTQGYDQLKNSKSQHLLSQVTLLYFQFWVSVFINIIASYGRETLWNMRPKNKKEQDAVAINERQGK
jgi:hypothetical protein